MDDNFELNFEPCIYSNRLLEKLTLINIQKPAEDKVSIAEDKVSIAEVKKAIYFAREYHGSQMRQSGEPYYSHPLEVAYMVSDYLFRTDIIVTAILHDTIEDTELTYGMIKQAFGELIANQVMDLTRIKETGHKISSAEMVETLFKQKKYEVLLIKQFDRLHNMQTIGAKSPEKIKKIISETLEVFIALSIYFQIHEIEQKLIKFCFQNKIISSDSLLADQIYDYEDNSQLFFPDA